MSSTLIVKVPRKFFDDHESRDLFFGHVIRRQARQVLVELDRWSYDELVSDAEHYVSPWGPSFYHGEHGLRRSAQRTLDILRSHDRPTLTWPENEE